LFVLYLFPGSPDLTTFRSVHSISLTFTYTQQDQYFIWNWYRHWPTTMGSKYFS
jgi:hypothetical protein